MRWLGSLLAAATALMLLPAAQAWTVEAPAGSPIVWTCDVYSISLTGTPPVVIHEECLEPTAAFAVVGPAGGPLDDVWPVPDDLCIPNAGVSGDPPFLMIDDDCHLIAWILSLITPEAPA